MTGQVREPEHAALGTTRWTVDVENSTACFSVRNFGFNIVRGTVPIDAAYADLDERGEVVGSYAELDLSRVSTANARRDDDLRKPSLLDSASHPRLEFDAGRAEPSATGWTLLGRLASRGRSADIELTVTPVGEGTPTSAAVVATATLDRRDLGVRAPRIVIGRRIEIEVSAVLTRGG